MIREDRNQYRFQSFSSTTMCNVEPFLVRKDEASEEDPFLPCSKVRQVQKQKEAVQVGNIPFLLHHYVQTNDSNVHLLRPFRK